MPGDNTSAADASESKPRKGADAEQISRLFAEFDCNNAGVIGFLELKELLVYLGALIPICDLLMLLSEVNIAPTSAFTEEHVLLVYTLYIEKSRIRAMYKSEATKVHLKRANATLGWFESIYFSMWKVLLKLCILFSFVDVSCHYVGLRGHEDNVVPYVAIYAFITCCYVADFLIDLFLNIPIDIEPEEQQQQQQQQQSDGGTLLPPEELMSPLRIRDDGLIPQESEMMFGGEDASDNDNFSIAKADSVFSLSSFTTNNAPADAIRTARENRLVDREHEQQKRRENQKQKRSSDSSTHTNFFAHVSLLTCNPFYIWTREFYCDVLSSLPLDLFFALVYPPLAFPAEHLRLFKLHKFHQSLGKKHGSLVLASDVLLVHRTSPCLVYFFDALTLLHTLTLVWLSICPEEHEEDYVTGLYFVTYTLLTVGYGDIDVTTPEQKVFAIVMCVMSLTLNGLVMGVLALYCQKTSAKTKGEILLLSSIRSFENVHIPNAICEDILCLFYKSNLAGEGLIRGHLPPDLVDTTDLFLKVAFLENVAFFKNISRDCKISVAGLLQPLFAVPEECVIIAGEETRLFFIVWQGFLTRSAVTQRQGDGTEDTNDYSEEVLNAASSFGETAFLRGTKSDYTVQSTTYCVLLTLTPTACKHLSKIFPVFLEALCDGVASRGYSRDDVIFVDKAMPVIDVTDLQLEELERIASPKQLPSKRGLFPRRAIDVCVKVEEESSENFGSSANSLQRISPTGSKATSPKLGTASPARRGSKSGESPRSPLFGKQLDESANRRISCASCTSYGSCHKAIVGVRGGGGFEDRPPSFRFRRASTNEKRPAPPRAEVSSAQPPAPAFTLTAGDAVPPVKKSLNMYRKRLPKVLRHVCGK